MVPRCEYGVKHFWSPCSSPWFFCFEIVYTDALGYFLEYEFINTYILCLYLLIQCKKAPPFILLIMNEKKGIQLNFLDEKIQAKSTKYWPCRINECWPKVVQPLYPRSSKLTASPPLTFKTKLTRPGSRYTTTMLTMIDRVVVFKYFSYDSI